MELVPKGAQSALTVSETTFDRNFNEVLIHRVVAAYTAGARQDTRTRETRAEVTGSGKKPRHQKGTGRTRSGSIKSPIWHSSGVTFAAHPQDHSQKANKEMYRDTLGSILSGLVRRDRLIVVGSFSVEAPKTELLAQKSKDMALEDMLVVTGELDENLFLTACSLHKVDVRDATGIDPVSLVAFDKVVMTANAAEQVEEMLA